MTQFLNGTDPGLRQTRTPTVDTYTAGAQFTAGSSTQVSLSSDPGTENNVIITFDGITQHRDTYAVSGTTVTFDAAIATGVSKVEATYTTTIPAHEPADGSVTAAKLASGLGFGLTSMQVFTSSGTWTKPSGITKVKVTVVGGGGGGGGVPSIAAINPGSAGGGGGGTAIEVIDVSSTSSATVTIGAGGAGGTSSGTIGTTGGTSSFGSFCSATGGVGGQPAIDVDNTKADGGAGGSGSGGAVNVSGGSGDAGYCNSASDQTYNGGGGGSTMGSGAGRTKHTTAGKNATDYGGGGAGVQQAASTAGGNGYQGVVIVEEYK